MPVGLVRETHGCVKAHEWDTQKCGEEAFLRKRSYAVLLQVTIQGSVYEQCYSEAIVNSSQKDFMAYRYDYDS